MKKKLLRLLTVIFLVLPTAHAQASAPLGAELTLTHITANRWRADYLLAEPVESIDLGPKVGDYRQQAWRILTPGVALAEQPDQDSITAGGKPFSAFSVEISLFLPYAQGAYTAFDRMSDGGTDVFLGFLTGDAVQGGRIRPLRMNLHLEGLASETVIGPERGSAAGLQSYAYFGPARPTPAENATVILDPRTPDWVAEVLRETTARITRVYEQSFQRPLSSRPLLMVSISDFETPGLSTKGGAVGKQVVYRLGGKALLRGSPQARLIFMKLIAHELAHVWQNDVSRGGIGGNEAWVHEGGAEAIALAGLRKTGLFDQAEADAYELKLVQECDALNGSVDTYRGFYACGFKRFSDYRMDVFMLWKSMMEASESSGEFYSSSMIETIRKGAGPHAASTWRGTE